MIRSALLAWRSATESLLEATKKVADETREEAIDQIQMLLDERDKLQPEMIAPFTDEEKLFGKELLVIEADVQKKLALFTKRIRMDISESQSKKDHMKNYVNPYSNVARDGLFYDTKQ